MFNKQYNKCKNNKKNKINKMNNMNLMYKMNKIWEINKSNHFIFLCFIILYKKNI